MGMGGSGLPACLAASICQTNLKNPFFIHQHSLLPTFIKKDDLVIVSSYSGNTRETLEFYDQAKKNGLNVLGITSGGELEKQFKKDKALFFKIDVQQNPANQPRTGVGFGIGFLVKALLCLNWLDKEAEKKFLLDLKSFDFGKMVNFENDLLKTVASSLEGKICLIFATPKLAGLGRFYQNQINETAKQPAKLLVFPELNHYFLEGLSQLKGLKNDLAVLVLETGQEKYQDQKTIDLTVGWLKQHEVSVNRLPLSGPTPVQRLFWGLSFGQQLALSLSYLNNANPVKISQIKWFKKEMAKYKAQK